MVVSYPFDFDGVATFEFSVQRLAMFVKTFEIAVKIIWCKNHIAQIFVFNFKLFEVVFQLADAEILMNFYKIIVQKSWDASSWFI